MLVIDDVGWDDVGLHSPHMYTPALDDLFKHGIEFQSMYAQPVCSPTRTALLQGRFPFRRGQGLQHYSTIKPGSSAHMPLSQPTVPELLKKVGYKTHAVGKWHCGYQEWAHTPTGRGFDTHMGYFQGQIDYFNKTFLIPHRYIPVVDVIGVDWWANRTVVKDQRGIHNKYLYDREIERVIDVHAQGGKDRPMFLYYAHQVAHYPIEPPKDAVFDKHCRDAPTARREKYCRMMAALDDSVSILVNKLKETQMWNDTLLFITSDNGGLPFVPTEYPSSAGSNYPFRAGKGRTFEGGVKVVAGISGGDNVLPAFARKRKIPLDGPLMHAVDWFPTILNRTTAAKYMPANVDGRDVWHAAVYDPQSVVHVSLPLDINHAVEFPDFGRRRAVLTADGYKLIERDVDGDTLNYDGWFYANGTNTPPPTNPTPGKFLFNIRQDPSERVNLYTAKPDIVARLQKLLDEYEKDYQDPQSNFVYPASFPVFHDGVWAPFTPIL